MRLHIDHIAIQLKETSFLYDADITSGITGIVGPSGSGKTTLMNAICGMVPLNGGRIVFNDRILFDKTERINVPPHKRNIGVVFQEHALFPHLTIKKNLTYSAPYTRHKKKVVTLDVVVELLEIGHLLHKRPAELSGGERQRVAIGRTLLAQPEILLLDEPFSNLDRNRRKQIISYLLKINRAFNLPLLIISHDLEDILRMTRSLIIVDNGRITGLGDYLDIAEAGLAPDTITHKRFINVIELVHSRYNEDDNLNYFGTDASPQSEIIVTNTKLFHGTPHKRARLCIFPDDIALSPERLRSTSIQNQIKGRVAEIKTVNGTSYVTIDCGVPLVAEITRKSLEQMNITQGVEIFCLVKAKAIEVVHIYGV